MKPLRIVLGVVIWLAGAAALWWRLAGQPEGEVAGRLTPELYRFATGQRQNVDLRLEQPQPLAVGDPIFVIQGDGSVRQVGEVRTVARVSVGEMDLADRNATEGVPYTLRAELLLYAGAPEVGNDSQVIYYETPGSMEWVLKTMLPPEKREQVIEEMSDAFAAHQDEILAALRPVVEASFREGLAVVEQDLAASLKRHKPELEQLGGKYQHEIVEREIVPLVRQEIWPIVRRRAEPTAEEVGREIWQRASLWRFGWRYAYDQSPLPDRNLTQREWDRFVQRDVIPVLESHTDDFVRVQQEVLSDVAKNPQVQATVRRSLARVVDDPELQRVVWQIIREVIIDNPRLAQVLHKHWTSPEAKAAFSLAAQRLEPSSVRIGELLFGSREEGITPEFARVLRNQILGKDKRWLVLEAGQTPSPGSPRRVSLQGKIGGEPRINPFVPSDVVRRKSL